MNADFAYLEEAPNWLAWPPESEQLESQASSDTRQTASDTEESSSVYQPSSPATSDHSSHTSVMDKSLVGKEDMRVCNPRLLLPAEQIVSPWLQYSMGPAPIEWQMLPSQESSFTGFEDSTVFPSFDSSVNEFGTGFPVDSSMALSSHYHVTADYAQVHDSQWKSAVQTHPRRILRSNGGVGKKRRAIRHKTGKDASSMDLVVGCAVGPGTRPYRCADCGRAFQRQEHYGRHQESHLTAPSAPQEKKYHCALAVTAGDGHAAEQPCTIQTQTNKRRRQPNGSTIETRKRGCTRADNSYQHYVTHLRHKDHVRNKTVDKDFLFYCIRQSDENAERTIAKVQKACNKHGFVFGKPDLAYQQRHPLYASFLEERQLEQSMEAGASHML